jgi:hypothetical protein
LNKDNSIKYKTSKPKNMKNKTRDDNLRRAKASVFDIASINEFTHFITWTLDKNEIDRYNSKEISKKLKIFLNHMKTRNNMTYLVVPEHHKDGAIHMHGLIKGNIKLENSGLKTKDDKIIYNMPQWSLGYSTAIEITGDKERVSKYILKYISKDFNKIFGAFYYAGGKGLKRKPPVKLYHMDYNSVNTKEYIIKKAKIGFKYIDKPVLT